MEFVISKSKNSLAFVELLVELPQIDEEIMAMDNFPDKSLFLISTSNFGYGDILLYLQTQCFWSRISHDDHRRIRHQYRQNLILYDTI